MELGICKLKSYLEGNWLSLMVVPVVQPTLTVVDTLDETERGAGGFGSTGR